MPTASNLKVRRIDWDLDDVPFLWNPENPQFAIMMNQISFMVVGFERYICRATRRAEAQITDPAVAEEARLFREQEAAHSLAHQQHLDALIRQHPGLQGTYDKVIQVYNDLYDEHPLQFALAHSGGLEAIFTPFFKMILDHRRALFGGGDPRVASLFLWHFCEEVEHRSAALTIYNHLVGSYMYRLRNTRRFMRFSVSLMTMLIEEFKAHVPGVPPEYFEGDPLAAVPRSAKLRSTLGILLSQMPWHDPEHQPLPDYYQQWLAHWERGDDVAHLYGDRGLLPPPKPVGSGRGAGPGEGLGRQSSADSSVSTAISGGRFFRLGVLEVIDETDDSKSFVLAVPDALAERFAYRAGQFLRLRVWVDGEPLLRCYSISSAPGIDTGHKITIKRVEGGRVSNWMNDNVRAGSVLEVMPPNGTFVLHDDSSSPLVLFSAGSGSTPCVSIVKTALATTERSVTLVYANRNARSVIFHDELQALSELYGERFRLVLRMDDIHGRLDRQTVVEEVGANVNAEFYICGPAPFIEMVEGALLSIDVPPGRTHIERFVSPQSEAPTGPLTISGEDVVTLCLEGEEIDVEVGEGETILAAARRCGLEPPAGCESAFCGGCMARLVSGKAPMRKNDGGLDPQQQGSGWILTCQALVKGRARVEYPD